MATVRWSARASDQVEEIGRFVGRDSDRAATAVVSRIVQATMQLEMFPHSGRIVPEDRSEQLRELVVANYRIFYEVEGDLVRILAVHHAARRFRDPRFEGSWRFMECPN